MFSVAAASFGVRRPDAALLAPADAIAAQAPINNGDSAYRIHVKSNRRGTPHNLIHDEKETHCSTRKPDLWKKKLAQS
jgi:hypothetical protein